MLKSTRDPAWDHSKEALLATSRNQHHRRIDIAKNLGIHCKCVFGETALLSPVATTLPVQNDL